MSVDSEPTFQDPAGETGIYPCPSCQRDTSHTILAIVNSRDFEGDAQFLNHYLTVKCNGCGTVSFCHAWSCTEEEEYDERGRPFLRLHKKHYPEVGQASKATSEGFLDAERLKEFRSLPKNREDRRHRWVRRKEATWGERKRMRCVCVMSGCQTSQHLSLRLLSDQLSQTHDKTGTILIDIPR